MSTLVNDLNQEISGVLQGNLNAYLSGVKSDLKSFLQNNQTQISTWAAQLQSGAIGKDDLNDNMLNLADLFKITSLTEAGISAIQAENIVNQILDIISNKLVNFAIGAIVAAL
jgi:hypothetical protein